MKTKIFVRAALFAALTAVFSQILIPLPFAPVPVSPALLVPLLCGRLLGLRQAVLSMGLYLALGALGLPVFAGLAGGFGVFLTPSGGFLFGYLFAAVVAGQRRLFPENDLAALSLATLPCYFCGTLWYMLLTASPFSVAVSLCVLPFLPGDALKIALGLYLVKKLRPHLKNFA